MILKASTAYSRKFFMVSSSDHISGKTGLNGAVTVYLTKGPGAAATLASNSGANVVELDSTHAPGWYQILLNVTDTGITGDLTFTCTGTGADPTDFVDQVQGQVFTDLVLSGSGRVLIGNNLQQNTAGQQIFPMTSSTTGLRQTGLTVTAQRTLGAGGFAACANSVTEIGTTGIYSLVLNASDLNASVVAILLTATGANDLVLPITPTP